MFIDTHCHIDFSIFDSDRVHILTNIFSENYFVPNSKLLGLIIPGVSEPQWKTCLALASEYKNVYFCAGIHPWFVASNKLSTDDLFAALLKTLDSPSCVAIGECGLDKTHVSDFSLQQEIFDVHLQVAKHTKQPLILHGTKTHNELIRQIKSASPVSGGVIHGFTGSYELAKTYMDMGFYIGVGGSITYERAKKTRDTIARLPLTALVLETDAPDMPLAGMQGQRNSPEHIFTIANVLAALRNEPLALIAEQTTKNASDIFNVPFSVL